MVKAVILAGGLGTRIGEETSIRPKPMIEVGGMPRLACAAEGGWLALHAQQSAGHPKNVRQAAAGIWFQRMYSRFLGDERPVEGAVFDREAIALRDKWRQPRPNYELSEILEDLAEFMALSLPETAEAYRRYWRGIFERRAALSS